MHHLTNFRLPAIHLPQIRIPRLGLPKVDLDDPRRFTEPLQFFFYLLMFVAMLAILTGATGTGVLMLIAGSALHVLRSSLEETAARRQARRERNERKRQVRLRSHRPPRKTREAPSARPAPQPAAEQIRASAAPRLQARRPPSPRPAATPARKQRVI